MSPSFHSVQTFTVGTVIAGRFSVLAPLSADELVQTFAVQSTEGALGELRLLKPRWLDSWGATADEIQQSFLLDPWIANQIDHPGVVQVLDTGVYANLPYLVYSKIEGKSLLNYLPQGNIKSGATDPQSPRLSALEIIEYLCNALEVLDVAHSQSIAHRNLHPGCLYVDAASAKPLQIVDFGLARLRELCAAGGQRSSNPMTYLPPESAHRPVSTLDNRTDLYSLASISLALLSAAQDPNASVQERLAALPSATQALTDLLKRALHPTPTERFQSVGEMYQAARRAWRTPGLTQMKRKLSGVHELGVAFAHTHPALPASSPNLAAPTGEIGSTPSQAPSRTPQTLRPPQSEHTNVRANASSPAPDAVALENLSQVFAAWQSAWAPKAANAPSAFQPSQDWLVVSQALEQSPSLSWELTPYGFTAHGVLVWQPTGALEELPRRLFAVGARHITIHQGVSETEWAAFCGLIQELLPHKNTIPPPRTRTPVFPPQADEVIPPRTTGEDFATGFWQAEFSHITCTLVPRFASSKADLKALTRQRRIILKELAETPWFDGIAKSQAQLIADENNPLIAAEALNRLFPSNHLAAPTSLHPVSPTQAALSQLLVSDEHQKERLKSRLETQQATQPERHAYHAGLAISHAVKEKHSLDRLIWALQSEASHHTPAAQIQCALALLQLFESRPTLQTFLTERLFTAQKRTESRRLLEEISVEQRRYLSQLMKRVVAAAPAQRITIKLGRGKPRSSREFPGDGQRSNRQTDAPSSRPVRSDSERPHPVHVEAELLAQLFELFVATESQPGAAANPIHTRSARNEDPKQLVRAFVRTLKRARFNSSEEICFSFFPQHIFINDVTLYAEPEIYLKGLRLGELLSNAGFNQLIISAETTEEDLLTFASAKVALGELRKENNRDTTPDPFCNPGRSAKPKQALQPGATPALKSLENRRLRLKRAQTASYYHLGLAPEEPLNLEDKPIFALNLYAVSLALVRRYHQELTQGLSPDVLPLKRMARAWVEALEAPCPIYAQLTNLVEAQSDFSARSLQQALLFVLVARSLSSKPALLQDLFLAALDLDIASLSTPEAAHTNSSESISHNGEAAKRSPNTPHPGPDSAPLSGHDHELAALNYWFIARERPLTRSWFSLTVASECAWLEKAGPSGVYFGKAKALLASQLLHLCRSYFRLRTPCQTGPGATSFEALKQLSQSELHSPTLVRLLMRCLGNLPLGSVVQLSTGELGVIQSASSGEDFLTPKVQCITNPLGNLFKTPTELDLSEVTHTRIRELRTPLDTPLKSALAVFSQAALALIGPRTPETNPALPAARL